MGGHITVPTNPKDKPAPVHHKAGSVLSKHMKPEHKRMSRLLGCCLTLGEAAAWDTFSSAAFVWLSPDECGALTSAAIRSLQEDRAIEECAQALEASDYLMPPFLGGMTDARLWASLSTVAELKAYAAAAFEALPPKEQSSFFRFINEIEVPA